ncbi:hypothetical protein [Streptomyces canus]|uniref:hypothetical protein n=1 Tax=Streptomyces canus TaxID=58343 RepID=UPI0030E2D0BC
MREKLTEKWSPQQIARYLAREHAHDAAMRACPGTIYRALFAGLLGRRDAKLRTGRTHRKRQRRGVCNGTITLSAARSAIKYNWTTALQVTGIG